MLKSYPERYLGIQNPTDINHPIFVFDIQTILSVSKSKIRICCGYPKKLYERIIDLFGWSGARIISILFTPRVAHDELRRVGLPVVLRLVPSPVIS
jgi:hypothetical protein